MNRRRIDSQQGSMIVIASVLIAGLLVIASLVVDVGMVRVQHRQINIAADAGAMAGVLKLLDPTSSTTDVVTEAQNAAAANGLTAAEIAARGTIDVGNWDGSQFVSGASPLNAVRVPGERSVLFSLGRLIWTQMNPAVDSIASLAAANDVSCVIPFGLEWPALFDVNNNNAPLYQPGDLFVLTRQDAGNWGKIDIGGNMSSAPNFIHAMQDIDCSPEVVSVGDSYTVGSGSAGMAGVKDAFEWRLQNEPVLTMAIVDDFPNGNSSTVNVMGFVVVEIMSVTGSGNNWTITLKFLDDQPVGATGGGAPNNGILANARVLVQ